MRIPVSTYRLQFNKAWNFQHAAKLVPYLNALGISDCYASPYLRAVPGSTHGYDVVDPNTLNPEIGTESDNKAFIESLKVYGMGQVLDVVPNHMGITDSFNVWWQDVLENGPSSRYASFFDIDWTPVKLELENKVLLPILGDQYGIVLENQEIMLKHEDGRFFCQYYQHELPLDPASWILILNFRIEDLTKQFDSSDPHFQELQSITTALAHFPLRTERDPDRVAERYREKEVIRRRLASLAHDSQIIASFIEDNIKLLNGTKDSPHSFDLLDSLLSDQAYRLASWRVASEEINYRRFFDVNELAAIHMEDPQVFREVHALVFDLLRSGAVTGLRVDHVDGLFDPRTYLGQWQSWAREELGILEKDRERPLFIIVEKILSKGETLAEDWPIHGTSGYDFLFLLNNLFVDTSHKKAFDDIYARFTKERVSYDELAYGCKQLIMDSAMSSEINTLGYQLDVLSEQHRRSRDFTLNSLIHAIKEIIACFPVYRTYVTQDPGEEITDRDRAYIRLAVTKAKRKNPTLSGLVFDFIRDLLLKHPPEVGRLDWEIVNPFVMKFQQTTSPVTAKGVEDTTFYRYNRLISLNEVGGEPDQFGILASTFHERMRERQQRWPSSLSATSTHDSKRSEDVRTRINVLSELPKEWRSCLARWQRINKKKKPIIEERRVPDLNEEYLFYQTLVGVWPFLATPTKPNQEFCDRIQAYMNKVLKEAKLHTSWINPNEEYERAVRKFIDRVLDHSKPNAFLEDFLPFQQKIAQYGMYNSLAQVIVKITAPGIPDFYQGSELWDLSLVDPDNRRAVNYDLRRQLLESLVNQAQGGDRKKLLTQLVENRTDGRIKLYTTMITLQYRRAHASTFLDGTYLPLESSGEKQHHVFAFARKLENHIAMTIVPRFLTRVIPDPTSVPAGEEVWGNTGVVLPPELTSLRYRNVLTEETISSITHDGQRILPVGDILHYFPVSIVEPES